LERKQFGDLRVGILTDNVLQLRPQHLFTFLMEESALTPRGQTMLADKGGLAALRVNADHVALVAVDALRGEFDWLVHN
jgi:hypothetical protein